MDGSAHSVKVDKLFDSNCHMNKQQIMCVSALCHLDKCVEIGPLGEKS